VSAPDQNDVSSVITHPQAGTVQPEERIRYAPVADHQGA